MSSHSEFQHLCKGSCLNRIGYSESCSGGLSASLVAVYLASIYSFLEVYRQPSKQLVKLNEI
tara:strand:- start:930 stop:1115 length:186 start_codon:yes stop_codon:yes gene_type:complete